MKARPELIFIYDHFYPDFTAGGPVTSLGTLSDLLSEDYNVSIITGAFAFATKQIMPGIAPDSWTRWKSVRIWYATSLKSISAAFSSFDTGCQVTVYLNGIYSVRFFLIPLIILGRRRCNVIVCPRGMLQRGALKRGKLKKKFICHC